MKAILSCTCLLMLLALHGAAQAQALQLYGRLNLGLERIRLHAGDSAATSHRTRLSNYRSVFGVRGSEAIAPGLQVLFQVEGTLAPDTGAGAFAARDTRIGLEGRWGTLFAGNWTLPYNASSAALDPFYPTTAGYMSIMGNGAAATADNASDTTSFDRRQRNSVHYWSPAWNGVSLRLAHGLGEERPAGGAKPSLISSALLFERGALYAALAHERHHDYRGPRLHGRLFAHGFSTKRETRLEAVGMGLSICQAIVRAHGGEIHFAPQAPHGACFRIRLPLPAAAAAATATD